MGLKKLQTLACLWGLVFLLLLVWLHVVYAPDTVLDSVPDSPEKQTAPAFLPKVRARPAEPAAAAAAEQPQDPQEEFLEDDQVLRELNLDGLGEDSAATSAPLASPDPVGHALALQCLPEAASEPPALEDNSARLQPQEGDYEVLSQVPDVLPGATLAKHHHGVLGRWRNGTCCRWSAVPMEKKQTKEEKEEAHKGFCFNSRISESVDVDRKQKDFRTERCKRVVYPCQLPSASVVVSFHNEHFATLLRSLHSVLNNSPAPLLRELILIDDASELDEARFPAKHFNKLQGELEEYCKNLPKVRFLRLGKRRGVVGARMEGAWRAKGEVLIFLDSHVEVTPGWLEPLLDHIKKDRKAVALPNTDIINFETIKSDGYPGVGPFSFTWMLGEHLFSRPKDDTPSVSPIIAGGHMAIDRAWFLYLGGYDTGMQLYAGEDVEMGFRTWMCGGSIVHLPCSHVGHIFRQGTFWNGQVYTVPTSAVIRNKHRAAEVWMDDYKEVVKLMTPMVEGMEMGSVEERVRLREKLNCRPFTWYLANVATDVKALTLQNPKWQVALMNVMGGGCLDTLGETEKGAKLGVYPCHEKPDAASTQAVTMNPSTGVVKLLRTKKLCLGRGGRKAILLDCGNEKAMSVNGSWRFVPARGMANVGQLSLKSGVCLSALRVATPKSPFSLAVEACSLAISDQFWTWRGP